MINFLRQIFKKSKESNLFKLIILVFVGLILSEISLRFMGLHSPTIEIDWRNIAASITNTDIIDSSYKNERLNKPDSHYEKMENYIFFQLPVENFEYGIGLIPDCLCIDIFKKNNTLVWNTQYKIDSFGRRETPEALNLNAEKFAVFYGGSRTFGQGVKDNETLPNSFQKLAPSYQVYNYGIPSAGPNIFLKKHQKQIFSQQVKQKKGLFIYVYDYGHASRLLGLKETYWSYDTPYYDLSPDNELILQGSFWSARYFRSAFFFFGSHSAIYQNTYLRTNWYSERNLSQNNLLIIKKTFLEMKKEASKHGNSDLVVVFFKIGPHYPVDAVINTLQNSGIETIVFKPEQLPVYNNNNYFIYDGHPTSSTYQTQAQLLNDELIKRRLINK